MDEIADSRSPARRIGRVFGLVRWTISLLALGTLFGAFVQFAKIDSPYEGWDEVGTFNNSAVMWSPLRTRTYTYGFLDTAKMALGRRFHEGALAPGMCMGETIYSNNVPGSFSVPVFEVAKRDWVELSAIDFNYFRGLVDRHGLFYARLINIVGLLLISLAILVVLEFLFGGKAMAFGATALFWLMSGYEFAAQSSQALPNATNTLLALLVALLSGGAALKGRWRWLVLGTVVLAVGINHKIDFLLLGLPLAAAAAALAFQQRGEPARVFKMGILLLLCFAVSALLTNPYLFFSPVSEITRQFNAVQFITSSAVDVRSNWSTFGGFLARQFSGSTSGAEASPVAIWIGLMVWGLAAGMFLIGGTRETRWIRMFSFAFLAGAGLLLLLTPVFRSNSLYHRYFLNGTGVLMALPIFGFAVTAHARSRVCRIAAGAFAVAVLAALALRADSLFHALEATNARLAPGTGLDLRHSRNQAVQHLIDHKADSKFETKVLVDQHGYFDLAALRRAGLEPVFINCVTLTSVVRSLPAGQYAILAVSGDYEIEPRWAGLWDAPLRAKYDAYQQYIAALPIVFQAGSSRMKLLGWQPPAALELVILAELTVEDKL